MDAVMYGIGYWNQPAIIFRTRIIVDRYTEYYEYVFSIDHVNQGLNSLHQHEYTYIRLICF